MSSDSGEVAAIILAAGKGRRVGRSKALLKIAGETFLARIVRVAREAGVSSIVAVLPPDIPDPGIDGLTIQRNPDTAGGPSSSLRMGLDAMGDADAVLSWPVDHPMVRTATVRAVIDRWHAGPVDAVVPTFKRRGGHPTLFARSLYADLRLLEGEGANRVLRRRSDLVVRMEVDDEGVVADVDTPEDLARLGVT